VIDDGSGQLRPSLTPKTYHHQGKHSTINRQWLVVVWLGRGTPPSAGRSHDGDWGGNIDQSVDAVIGLMLPPNTHAVPALLGQNTQQPTNRNG
jgi:hypothetical protein